jgi:hypothetical protein
MNTPPDRDSPMFSARLEPRGGAAPRARQVVTAWLATFSLVCAPTVVATVPTLFAPSSARAAPAAIPTFQARLTESGTYRLIGRNVLPAQGAPGGNMLVHQGSSLIDKKTQLAAVQGAVFGFKFELTDLPDGAVDGLQMRVMHPRMTHPGSKKSQTQSVADLLLVASDGKAQGEVLYELTERHEVLPGRWTIQVLHSSVVLLSVSFDLQ